MHGSRPQARLYRLFEQHTQRSVAEIERALDRDYFMSAEEGMAFGLIDEVVTNKPKQATPAKEER
jgi:ATP-dependent Clp protease protease subunit